MIQIGVMPGVFGMIFQWLLHFVGLDKPGDKALYIWRDT